MTAFKIGVIVESFRRPMREALLQARQLGVDGVQIVDHSLNALVDPSLRRAFRAYCRKQNLDISAIIADPGGHGLSKPSENPLRVANLKRTIDLAADLKVGIVTAHIGAVPSRSAGRPYRAMVAAGAEVAAYGVKRGVTLAVETGPEKAVVLKRFLDDVGSKGIGVNLDPANLVMVAADDPVQAVYTLGHYIVHTHAKDGVQLQPCDPAEVYEAFAVGGFGQLQERMGKLFEELPLGRGQVKWTPYLNALREIGFKGYLTVEREVGSNPGKDIAMAVRFLRKRIGCD